MFRSATFKLTMWYLAIVMAISLCFSVILYRDVTIQLSQGLHRETERIDDQFPVFQNNPILDAGPNTSYGDHRILLRLIGFNVIVLFGAGGASYWLARRTLKPIEDAHEQQKRFTADVSHELRTPLTVLRMESEIALMSPATSTTELRATLASNLEEVGKLEGLINNLLRLSRLEVEEVQDNFIALDTANLAADAVERVSKLAADHTIKLDTAVVSAKVMGDQDSLVQMLVILLDNAIKYSPAKGTVTLTGHVRSGSLVFNVIDQGHGIDRAALDHVFDRFYRADDSRAKIRTEGFGLGLSIAKMIADIHDATITLASSVGHGTTASVSLPIVKVST